MIFEHHSCRSYLKELLSEGLMNGSVSSLRGLAQRLDISPSFLSEIFNGKRNLSEEKAMRTAGALGLDSAETSYFHLIVRYDACKNMSLKESLLNQIQGLSSSKSVNDLSVDQFKMMSDWYYSVILELLNISTFNFSARTIGKRLSLPVLTVQEALDRLTRLGLIKVVTGKYQRVYDRQVVNATEQRSAALCKYHKQLLERSMIALEKQAPEKKFVGSEIFAFDVADLDKARLIMESCFDQLVALGDNGKNRTEVFYSGIQFLNISI